MGMYNLSTMPGAGRLAWLTAFVGASFVFSLGLACAVPLAAFAAVAALTQCRRDALVFVGTVWFTNQLTGFAVLNYPTDWSTFGWGAAMGVIAMTATLGAETVSRRIGGLVSVMAAFLAAFGLYEGLLWVVTMASGTVTEAYAPATMARIFALNAAAFAALLATSTLAARAGVGKLSVAAIGSTQGHA
jgi:hypothetical protein